MCLILGGCADIQLGTTFNKDGSATQMMSFESAYPEMHDKIKEAKEDQQKHGYDIKETSNGFIATKHYKDVQAMVMGGGDFWNPQSGHDGIAMRKGFLYDYYSLDSFIKGQTLNMPKSNYQPNMPSVPFKVRISREYMQAEAAARQQADDLNRLSDEAARAAVNSFKAGYTLNLPYAADGDNADQRNNDGKTLVWNLKPAFTENKDVTIQARFRIYHEDTITGLLAGAGILSVAAVVLLVLGMTKKDPLRKKQFLGVAAVLIIVLISGAGYAKYTIDNPPVLTSNDRITSNAAGEDTSKKAAAAKPANSADDKALNAVYDDIGKAGKALAVSPIDDKGYLALVQKDSSYYFVVRDAADKTTAWVSYDSKIYNFKPASSKKTYSPVIFNMDIANDAKDQDQQLGTWQDNHHIIPIYALYDIDGNGTVVPGMLTSGAGLKPSHYQAPLKEMKNVNLANVLLTHMDGLKQDVKDRNVTLP